MTQTIRLSYSHSLPMTLDRLLRRRTLLPLVDTATRFDRSRFLVTCCHESHGVVDFPIDSPSLKREMQGERIRTETERERERENRVRKIKIKIKPSIKHQARAPSLTCHLPSFSFNNFKLVLSKT
jgi:hypothetical protein